MELEDYRREIDHVNREIVDAISRRMNVVEEVGAYKKSNGMDIVDEEREEEVKQQFEKLFEEEELPKERGRELAELLIDIALEKEGELR